MNYQEKHPKDFQEFLTQFSDENACWAYLMDIRCPDGYICKHCESNNYWLTAKHKMAHPQKLWIRIMIIIFVNQN